MTKQTQILPGLSRKDNPEAAVLLGLAVVAVAVRLAALLVWGPLYQNDSLDFVSVADILLRNISTYGDSAQSEVIPSLRMIGYSALIAGSKILFGSGFDEALVVMQSAFSVLATILVFRLARALGLGILASAFAALAHTTSILLLFDLNILVDSFFANGLFIAAALMALGILSGGRPEYLQVLGVGAILAITFLLRETTIYFAPFWALGSVIWARHWGMRWNRALICFVLVMLPAALSAAGYREWNRARVGEAFLTTGAQFTMWFAPVEVARKAGVEGFSDDPRVAAALRLAIKTAPDTPMLGADAINAYLAAEYGMRAPQIARLGFQAYFRSAQLAPLVLFEGRLARFRPRAVLLLVNASQPLEVMRDLGRKTDSVGFREQLQAAITDRDVGAVLALALEVAQLAVSGMLLLAFLVGVPWMIVRYLRRGTGLEMPLLLAGWFWLLYAALNGAYVLASFEGRYAMATLPLACIGGLWVFSRRFYFFRAVRNES